MSYKVNLAAKPFQNRSLFWLALLLGFGLVFFAGLSVTADSAEMAYKAALLADTVKRQEREIEDLKQKQPKQVKVDVKQEEAEALRSAHELISRKAFSWTTLLNQINKLMPQKVRLISIGIERADIAAGQRRSSQQSNAPVDWLSRPVPLTLEVATQDEKHVIDELLTNFNKQSQRFNAFVLEQAPQPETNEIIFTIAIDYLPANAKPAETAAPGNSQVAQAGGKQ